MGHADEVNTSVDTKRVFASERDGEVSIAWDYPGRTLLEVRILRSGEGFASGPEPTAGQLVVYEDVTGSFRDPRPVRDDARYYTVFARQPGQEWHRWAEFVSQATADVTGLRGYMRLLGKAWRNRIFPVLIALLCLAGLLVALPARAAGEDTTTKAAADKLTAEQQQAVTIAAADPQVAAVVGAADPPPTVTQWPDAAGATLAYAWPASEATNVAAVWPLVTTNGSGDVPVAPYTQRELRLRVADLTGLRVDVLYEGSRVIQIMPADGATQFELREQTWAPFSWFPWFTERPWVLVPLFVAIGVIIIWRAWLRSRAWNRRLPSMTRHDRQFIGRLAVIIFLIAGFAWLIYEGIVAARLPSIDPNAVGAGDLAALPLLLIPPGLFLAALVLELSWQPHRVAWGLLAVLAGAGSAYYLAGAMTGTATNLDLSFYILLAVLALIAIPRAFSLGKMGWSRSMAPRYG